MLQPQLNNCLILLKNVSNPVGEKAIKTSLRPKDLMQGEVHVCVKCANAVPFPWSCDIRFFLNLLTISIKLSVVIRLLINIYNLEPQRTQDKKYKGILK